MTLHVVLDGRVVNDHFPGIGRYVVNLAQALARVAPDLNVSLLYDPSAPATRLILPDLPRVACPVSPFSVRQQWIVPRQLRRMQATLYHSPYYLMPYAPGTSTVFTCHDLIPLIYAQYFSAVQRLIYRLTHALALKTARMTVAVSRTTQADLIRYFHLDPQRVIAIPEAVDDHFSPRPSEQITAVRQKHVLPEEYVLYVGSNKPHKNLARLVQAWKICRSELRTQNLKLVIAGQWDRRYLEAKRLVGGSGLNAQVFFVGPVDDADLPALYSGAMLFIFPSLYEGFGLPVLEAMACGTPVVCSNTSSLPEVVGEAGLLFDPLNPDEIAASIQRVLENPGLRVELRQRGLARAAQFTWERVAEKTMAVYRAIVNTTDEQPIRATQV